MLSFDYRFKFFSTKGDQQLLIIDQELVGNQSLEIVCLKMSPSPMQAITFN